MKKLIVDGISYVPEGSVTTSVPAKLLKGMKYCLVRGYQSGVWAGWVKSQEGTVVIIVNARNVWYWKGAASLAQMSQEGIKNLKESKITQEVPEMTLLDANTVIPCTEKAMENLTTADVWKS